MPLYTKEPKELVLSLIKEANPNLVLPLTASGVSFSAPKAITVSGNSFLNTEITITARGNSGYTNKTTVRYRRISLDTLFRGLSAEVYKYTAKSANQYPFDIYGLLAEINNRFGLNLTQDDVENQWFPWQNDKYYPDKRSSVSSLKAKAGSLVWVGKAVIRWVSDRQSIADMITKRDLAGRLYPGGDSVDSEKYVLNCATYRADFGEFDENINSQYNVTYPLGIANATIAPYHNALLAAINEVTGETYTFNTTDTPFGLGGIVPLKYTLPDAAVPEANSHDYNRVLVIPYPTSGAWGAGRLLLHFNV